MRTSNEKRELFLKLFLEGFSQTNISKLLNLSRKTITNFINLYKQGDREGLFSINNTRQLPKHSDVYLSEYFSKEDSGTKFHYEVANELGISHGRVSQLRKRLGFVRKQGKTIYRESDEDLKKTLE